MLVVAQISTMEVILKQSVGDHHCKYALTDSIHQQTHVNILTKVSHRRMVAQAGVHPVVMVALVLVQMLHLILQVMAWHLRKRAIKYLLPVQRIRLGPIKLNSRDLSHQP